MTHQNEIAVPQPGNGQKCTRCGRALKRAYMVNGTPYGPVCVRKLGFTIASDGTASRRRKQVVEQEDENQLGFFAPETTPDVVYLGHIGMEDRLVSVHRPGRPAVGLPLNLGIVNHSPTGFHWGYGGSGPAQLAFSILYDFLGHDKQRALALYQDFKFKVISGLDQEKEFRLTGQEIEAAISKIDIERMRA